MKLSVEELMRPRYEVIADWPGRTMYGETMLLNAIIGLSKIVKGSTEDKHLSLGHNSFYWKSENGMKVVGEKFFDKYPHLFKPLQWWERREASEMPEYVWCRVSGFGEEKKLAVLKVEKWTLEPDGDMWAAVKGDPVGWATDYMPKPATESEYSSYKQSIKS